MDYIWIMLSVACEHRRISGCPFGRLRSQAMLSGVTRET